MLLQFGSVTQKQQHNYYWSLGYLKIFLIIHFTAAVHQMLAVTQALRELNQWSDWDSRMTPSPATASPNGEHSPPGSGASGVLLSLHSIPSVLLTGSRVMPEAQCPLLPAEGRSGALTLYLRPKMHHLPGSGE